MKSMCVLSIVLIFVFCISNAQPGCQWSRSFPWRPFVALLTPLLYSAQPQDVVFCVLYFVFCILYFVICISNAQQALFLLRTTARLLQIQKQIQGQRIQLQLSDL